MNRLNNNSMPRSAVAAGCVDLVLSPDKIAKELARIARHPYLSVSAASAADDETESESPETPPADGRPRKNAEPTPRAASRYATVLSKILILLRNHSAVDFSPLQNQHDTTADRPADGAE